MDAGDSFMIGGPCQEKDRVTTLPQMFNDGDERGGRPAFLRSPAARMNGDIPVVGVQCNAQCVAPIVLVYRQRRNALGIACGPYILYSHGFCQVIHHMYASALGWTSRSNYDPLDACQTQVVFYHAIRVTKPADGKLSLLQLLA